MTNSSLELKFTPLHGLHLESGAKMGGFAGFDMPLFYPLGVMKEHEHTRNSAGLFDISHMVHMEIRGGEAAQLIERLCPYVASDQEVSKAQYTFFLNENAGIIDDLIVTRLSAERYLIVSNAGCAEKDIAHVLDVASGFAVDVEVLQRGFVALQGPLADAVLTEFGFDVASLPFMTGREGANGWFISRSGYTGEDGFEIAMPVGECEAFVRKLITDDRVELIGLGARDSLRLEAGLSLYGQDLDEDTTPHEAGLIWAIPKPLRKSGDYIGAQSLSEKFSTGRRRMRVGLLPNGRPVRGGVTLENASGEVVGQVTSGGFGPTLAGPMALGLVNLSDADEPIFADMRGKKIEMKRTKLPFVAHNYKR